MKTALIIGQTGQDGSYATELLHGQGYRVIGAVRTAGRVGPVAPDAYVPWNMRDGAAFAALLSEYEPDEVYNFAAYSSGSGMFDDPIGMGQSWRLPLSLRRYAALTAPFVSVRPRAVKCSARLQKHRRTN
jgi:GDP-D-mannose dehydratase